MRVLVTTVFVLAAAPAVADPCEVSIVRAPPGVAETIQSWVAREASCTTKLEVRVIPTTDGNLYIIARDDRGRLHERVVPTAENAGVLIASWVADDSVAGRPIGPEAPAGPDVPVTVTDDPDDNSDPDRYIRPDVGGPSTFSPVVVHDAEKPTPIAAPSHPRFLTIGALVGMSDGGGFGLRGEWDFSRSDSGNWVMGAMASASSSTLTWMNATFDTLDLRAGVYWQRVADYGKWQVRGGLGVGLAFTQASQAGYSGSQAAATVSPTAEIDLRVSRQINDTWSIGFEPIATVYAQEFKTTASSSINGTYERSGELAGFISMHHRM